MATNKNPKYATCDYCTKKMRPGASCNFNAIQLKNGRVRKRIPVKEETCPDCNAPCGGNHHPGCDTVRCPLCGGQESYCDCPITHYARLKKATLA